MQLRRALLDQEQRELVERRKEAEITREQKLRQQLPFGRPAKLYEWVQRADTLDMTVTVMVPPTTEKSEVKVKVDQDTLQVSVKGHPRQPFVLDGWFPYDVEPEGCTWHLEGDGVAQGDRKLVLNIDKEDYADWAPYGLFLQPDGEPASEDFPVETVTGAPEEDPNAPVFD